MKENRRKKLDKNLALNTFLQAFDKAGIERENTDLKTPKSYEILAREVLKMNGHDTAEYPNFDNYIKDRFNTLKRLVANPSKNTITFYTYQYDPIEAYADGTALHQVAEESIAKVLFSEKPYAYFNFWRMPQPASLVKVKNQLRLQTEDSTMVSIDRVTDLQSYAMPRDNRQYWLKVTYQNNTELRYIFLMPQLLHNQPDSTLYLQQKLSKFLDS